MQGTSYQEMTISYLLLFSGLEFKRERVGKIITQPESGITHMYICTRHVENSNCRPLKVKPKKAEPDLMVRPGPGPTHGECPRCVINTQNL